jgi:hypothetical protein
MENMFNEGFWDSFIDKIISRLVKVLMPQIEAMFRVPPRYMSIKTAGDYVDKTYEGMRHTINAHNLPVVYIGGKPRIDREDIDRVVANLKNRRN